MSKGIIRLDKVKSVYGGHIYSVRANVELENGFMGHLGDLVESDEVQEREIYNFVQPTTESVSKEPLVLIAEPEINYSERTMSDYALGSFSIPKDKESRAYEISRTDIISYSDNLIDAIDSKTGVVKGNFVVAQNGSFKLKEVASADLSGNETFVGKILNPEKIGTSTVVGMPGVISRVTTFIPIQVIKA